MLFGKEHYINFLSFGKNKTKIKLLAYGKTIFFFFYKWLWLTWATDPNKEQYLLLNCLVWSHKLHQAYLFKQQNNTQISTKKSQATH